MKKVLSLMLVFVFVVGICASAPMTIKANAASVDCLTFTLNDDGQSYFVSDCTYEAEGKIIIPSVYNGLPVTKIGDEAFFNTPHITEIQVPDTVLIIGEYAFSHCGEVESITGLEQVTSIGKGAFYGCSELKEAIFPQNLTSVGEYVFAFCTAIESVTIPEYVTVIDETAFYNCTKLKTVKLHNDIASLGRAAFANCTSLVDINLPEDLSEISEELFSCCTSLETIAIPDTGNYIGDSAFGNCLSLETIVIPEGVKLIEGYTFSRCEKLSSVVLPEGLTKISQYAFYECGELKEINIPSTLTQIGKDVFYNCVALKTVTYNGTKSQWKSIAFETGNDNLLNANIVFSKEEIPHTHSYTETVVKEATCTEKGTTKFACECGYIFTEDNIPAKGHTTSIVGAKDATTEETGYTGDKYCSVCQTIVEKGKEIPKLAITLTTPTVKIANTSKGIKVSWNAIENAENYVVYRRVYNASTKKWSGWSRLKSGVTSTSYTDKTVKLGTNYRYTVRAVNGSVMSAYKTTSTLKYNVTPTVKVANASNGIKVSWSTAANATGYTVYSSTYNAKTKKWSGWTNRGTTKSTTTSWVDKKVKSGVKYKYTVRACNGKFKSNYKASANLLYLAQPKTTVKAVSNGINVAWTQCSGATGYTVYRMEYNTKTKKWSGWTKMGTAKSNKKAWTDKSAKKGVTYRYTVRAVNGKVASSYKASANVKR